MVSAGAWCWGPCLPLSAAGCLSSLGTCANGLGHIVMRRGRFVLLSGLLWRRWLCWLRLAIGGRGLFVRKWYQFGRWSGLYITWIVAASFLHWSARGSAFSLTSALQHFAFGLGKRPDAGGGLVAPGVHSSLSKRGRDGALRPTFLFVCALRRCFP